VYTYAGFPAEIPHLSIHRDNMRRIDSIDPPKRPARKTIELLLVAFVILATWLPRGLALDRFVTTDEVLWLTRSANFYYALAHRDYKNTYQKEHPGVTVMWAGTLGFLTHYPEYRDSGQGQLQYLPFHDYLEQQSKTLPLQLLAAGRAFLVLGQTLVIALGFWYALRLIGVEAALVSFLLIAFDPFYLGLSRLLHLDALLSSLMLLSLFSFLSFLERRKQTDLVVSGAAAGLAFITKSPGLLLLPVIGLLSLSLLWRRYSQSRDHLHLRSLWESVWPVAAWLIIAALAMVILWPALWKDPFLTIRNVLTTAESYADRGHDTAVFFNGHTIPSGNLGKSYFYFYPVTFLWRTTPVVLLGLAAAVIGFSLRLPPFDSPSVKKTAISLTLLAALFTLGMTLGSKKFDRYLLPVHLCADVLAGLGWVFVAAWLHRKNFSGVYRFTSIVLLVLVIGLQMAFSLVTFPYYLSYYNPLLGGSRKAPEVMQIGWGEGLDQAGRYLSQKPNAQKLRIASWYSEGPFSYFFPGPSTSVPIGPLRTDKNWSDFLENDYVVLYIHQKQRGLYSKRIEEYVSERQPDYTVTINGIEYVRIYALP
jgi:4-amino-4-deoxy-L-arabinose transferase-like glycosyltransferase